MSQNSPNAAVLKDLFRKGGGFILAMIKTNPAFRGDAATAKQLHLRHMERGIPFIRDGLILAGGLIMDDSELKSVSILNVATKIDAQKFYDEDPAIMGGLYRVELYEWQGFLPAPPSS